MTIINTILEKMEKSVVEVPVNRKYWLVRTESGFYYDDFIKQGKISVGWNEFSNKSFFLDKKASDIQKDLISKAYPKVKQPSRIYNQIRKFIFELKIGDVVMIPDENSKTISFGVIKSDYYCKENASKYEFIKSRDVEWIKTIARKNLDPYLYKMMHAHQTINSANAYKYAHYIDRSMYSLFNKGENCYLNIKIGRKGNLPAYDLSRYLESVLKAIELTNDIKFNGYENDYHKLEDLDIKVNVQSRGWSLLSGSKKLITQFAVVSNAALYEDIDDLISDESTRIRKEKIQEIKDGMKRANADFPDDLI